MLAGIITGYFVIGTIATGVVEISARVGKHDDDKKLCEMIDDRPIFSRTNLIVGWPDWLISGIVKGVKKGIENRVKYTGEDK